MSTDTLYIMIGTDSLGGCAECNMVLEYSIAKHITGPYEIVRMYSNGNPNSTWSGWHTKNWATPFSGYRYGIAEYMQKNNLEGHCLYCDDDQLFLDDPRKILEHKIPEGKIMTGKAVKTAYGHEIRHCVSVIDHKRFNAMSFHKPSDIIDDKPAKSYPNYVNYCKNVTFPLTHIIGDEWNCYDGEDMDPKDIKLLHLTNMASNPGVKLAIKRLGAQAKHWYDGPIIPHRRPDIEDIFLKYYQEALDAGYKVEDFIPKDGIKVDKQSQKNYKANNGWG